ncbi:flagellin [Alteromonas macleodii]|uniref:Flagellin n=1 Tax=Alteromonas macleodii TaxID=28108 RepID=A0A6T9Y0M5_ALTMA|nr:flagellin [Alteromonas macleodii]CAB9493270.1 putative A-type flagellin [Alteromonas macleodii]
MFLHTNVATQQATNTLFGVNKGLSRSFEQLSSGLRINKASDDAAGLQISERLSSQTIGLNQAVENANSGQALLQVVDGSLSEVTRHLNDIRTLSIASQNGIYGKSDLASINQEVQAHLNEIARIADSTTYAGEKIFDGNFIRDFAISANGSSNIRVDLTQDGDGIGLAGLGLTGFSVSASGQQPQSLSGQSVSGSSALNAGEVILQAQDNPGEKRLSVSTDSGLTFVERAVQLVENRGVNAALISTTANEILGLNATSTNFVTGDVILNQTNADIRVATPTGEFQISSSLNSKVGQYDAQSAQQNGSTLDMVDNAIEIISNLRTDMGATSNRFSSALKSMSSTSVNLQRASAQITQSDFASVTAQETRFSILQKANVSVLAMANQMPQNVLFLLN